MQQHNGMLKSNVLFDSVEHISNEPYIMLDINVSNFIGTTIETLVLNPFTNNENTNWVFKDKNVLKHNMQLETYSSNTDKRNKYN